MTDKQKNKYWILLVAVVAFTFLMINGSYSVTNSKIVGFVLPFGWVSESTGTSCTSENNHSICPNVCIGYLEPV
ncbi:MAG TPA: hypothetical protein VLG13_03360, partial [Patescibacteria group bacterium]|nr:hypothetical protein [Patescibacteria group bacterium]